jgi:hypothetical protein
MGLKLYIQSRPFNVPHPEEKRAGSLLKRQEGKEILK